MDEPELLARAAQLPDKVGPVVEAVKEKFSRLREKQIIELEPVDPSVPIQVRKAHRSGHHGIVTSGAKVVYTKETV